MNADAHMKPHIRKEDGRWVLYRHYMPKNLYLLWITHGTTPKEAYDKYIVYINS